MAPKTRAYTKEELQSLRRADLQRLCKTYDIKGANAKSDALIEILVQYFSSPAYLASPKPQSSRPARPVSRNVAGRSTPALPIKAPKAKSSAAPPPAPARPPVRRPESAQARLTGSAKPRNEASNPANAIASTSGPTPSSSASTVLDTGSVVQETRPSDQKLEVAVRNTISDRVTGLCADMALLQNSVAALEQQQSDEALESRISRHVNLVINRHMALIEEREAALQRREEALDEAWSRLERAIGNHIRHTSAPPSLPNLATRPDASTKRKNRAVSPEGAHTSKRVCLGEGSSHITASAELGGSSPHARPRTPSAVAQTLDRVEEALLQPPAFTTTPRTPGEHSSPASARSIPKDGPPRAPYGRIEASGTRPHHDRTRRKVSQAHIDLSTITESRLVSETSPDVPFLGQIAVHKRTVSPPALSPSPSIGGDNFSYTTLPQPPKSRQPSSEPNARLEFSPGREYMNVALNGHWDPDASPSAHATPSSRTMIGTERFRDRRFADEVELVPWATPKVDFGRRS